MEPLFFPEDEAALLPPELRVPSRDYRSTPTSHDQRRDQSAAEHPGRGNDSDTSHEYEAPSHGTIGGGGGGGGSGRAEERKRERPQQQLPYDRHSVHVVTQYYIPEDSRRAREVGVCGVCLDASLER